MVIHLYALFCVVNDSRQLIYYSLLHNYSELYLTKFSYNIIHGQHSKLIDIIYIAKIQYYIENTFELLTI